MSTLKKSTIVLFIILGLFFLVALISYVLNRSTPLPLPSDNNPFASTTSSVGSNEPSISIQSKDGTSYMVPDPTVGKKFDAMSGGTYYQLTENQDTQGDQAQFEIVYGTDSSIQIGLTKEPLGQARLAAEKQLRTFFPLTNEQLCSLDVYLGVPAQVNETYAGKNLGLSFCPNAVKLP